MCLNISRFVRKHAILTATAILTAIAVMPAFLVAIPAIGDFPNHLARMYILVMNATADANPFYQVHFALYPNLAMDIMVPAIARFVSVVAATKTFLIISQLLIISGAMAIEFVVKHRHEFAGFVALFMLYSTPFSLGFMNFEFGMGLALWGIASWIAFRNHPWIVGLIVNLLFVGCLFAAHFFALGVYGATIGLLELPQFIRVTKEPKKSMRVFAILAGPAILAWTLMRLTGGALGLGAAESEWRLTSKLQSILLFFNTYNYTLSAIVMALLIALLYFLFRERYFSFSSEGKRLAVGFLLLLLLVPFKLFGSVYADVRIITAAVLILPAFLIFDPSRQISWFGAASLASIAIVANTVYIVFVWFSYQDDYFEVEKSFQQIEPRSFVLIGQVTDSSLIGILDTTYGPIVSAPTLAVYYAKAFVPNLFTFPGEQPVEVRPEYKQFAITNIGHYQIPVDVLKATANGTPFLDAEFLQNWPQHFDYVYIVGPHIPNPLPHRLTQITAARLFTLYRIIR